MVYHSVSVEELKEHLSIETEKESRIREELKDIIGMGTRNIYPNIIPVRHQTPTQHI